MTFKVASYIYIAAHQSTWYWLRCSAKCTFWSFKDLNKKKERKTTPGAATPPHKQHHHHYTFLSLSNSTFYIIKSLYRSFGLALSNISQRLTDLRFLSIDFLNTFLLTYRVFAEGVQVIFYECSLNGDQNIILWNAIDVYSLLKFPKVLEALKTVFFNPEPALSPSSSCGWPPHLVL